LFLGGETLILAAEGEAGRGGCGNFDMLLSVRNSTRNKLLMALLAGTSGIAAVALATASQNPGSISPTAQQQPGGASSAVPTFVQAPAGNPPQRAGLQVVVLDPAHGGTDLGARGTGGMHESEIVLEFAAQVRQALEAQGFQVVQTRDGNDNPSFDDRSAKANAQRGAVFVTLHISSTGLPGTTRVYTMTELPGQSDGSGLIPWDRAQAPFLSLSKKLADQVEGQLAQRFKGSPVTAQSAAVRQLRTTAAPAIAVEISSVAVEDRGDLDRMAPGVAEAITRGVVAFRPMYVVPSVAGSAPGVQP
jgi:N-acetylmuramoyl-L-alanine amidase